MAHKGDPSDMIELLRNALTQIPEEDRVQALSAIRGLIGGAAADRLLVDLDVPKSSKVSEPSVLMSLQQKR